MDQSTFPYIIWKHMKNVRLNIMFFIFAILQFACKHSNTELLLQKSDNPEILKVISHYKDDTLKTRALLFLIENMPYHSSLDQDYNSIHSALENAYQKDNNLSDSDIQNIHRMVNNGSSLINDSKKLTADLLISNIDHSFKVWKEKPWNKHLSFEDFCEYLLPYRVSHEPLENWKQLYYEKYNPILDSIYKGTDAIEAANALNLYIAKTERIVFNSDFKYVSPGASFYLNHKWGSCLDMRDIMLYIFRAVGIPAIGDFYLTAPTDTNVPHTWCAILDSTGHSVVVRSPGSEIGKDITLYVPPGKVYRSYFGVQPIKYKPEEVAPFFRNRFIKDVTAEYCGKNSLKIKLEKTKPKYVYLGVQTGHRTTLIDIASLHDGEAVFQNVQENIIYQLFYYEHGRLKEAGYPVQPKDTGVRVYKPDTCNLQTVTLYRKFPQPERLLKFRNAIIGAIFEGSNTASFQKKEKFYTFKDSILNVSTLTIYPMRNNPIRYLRYTAPVGKEIQIAELNFYEKGKNRTKLDYQVTGGKAFVEYRNGFLENVCDGNVLTHYSSYYSTQTEPAFMLCDFKRPVLLERIEITPRTDDNFIRIGDMYELFYHNGSEGWKSLGVQIATKQELTFHNIPENALLWLRNHTRGQEEQVFFIRNEKQIFIQDEVSWAYG